MNIALSGPSGVGKGTHVAALVAEFKLLHLSSGDLFRENVRKRTALGILARKYMDAGELVPDEVVNAMIEERLASAGDGVLFDGFPCTTHQAGFLDEFLTPMGRRLDALIFLRVSEEEVMRRLSGRLICAQCQSPYHEQLKPPAQPGRCDLCGGELYRRADDRPETVRNRLRLFHRLAGPLATYYQPSNRLLIIDGEGPVARVREALIEACRAVARGEARAASRAEAELLGVPTAAPPPPTPAPARPSLDLVLLGAPGSGKGTQAEQLSRQCQVPHVATGDLFRQNLKNDTDLGRLAKTYMNRGELVPDDVTEAMVQQRLAQPDTQPGFLLDGFPRTLPQAGGLGEMLTQLSRRLAGVIYIKVADTDILDRLAGRRICRQCQAPYHQQFKPPAKPGVCDLCGGELYQRDDDNPETVRARLKTFHAQTEPLIEHYRAAGLLTEVEGTGGVAAVTERTLAAAQALAGR